jgi:ABC-type antimicrobial peptide transport system permease subunit
VGTVQGMDDLVEESVGSVRATSRLLLASGALALLIAVVGLYGLVSHMVSQRCTKSGFASRWVLQGRTWCDWPSDEALAASYGPARRAPRIAPLTALRRE